MLTKIINKIPGTAAQWRMVSGISAGIYIGMKLQQWFG